MKVLLITYSFPPSSAVSSKRWDKLYEHSISSAIDFTILCANWSGEKIEDININYLGDKIDFSAPKSIIKKPNFLSILTHPTLVVRSISKTLFSNWFFSTKKWIDLNKSKSFDLIISSYGPMTSILLGNYAKSTFKVPLVIDLRDLISIQGQKLRLPFFHRLDILLDKYFTRKATQFLTVSPKCTTKAVNFYKKKVTTIYNGFLGDYPEKIDLSVNSVELNILYFGTLGLSRNPEKILSVFQTYSIKYPRTNIKVSFASQDNPNDYINAANVSNIQINWLGYLKKEELEKVKLKANILLLLEDQNPEGDENLTGKIYEYITLKKPIIASCSPTSDIVKLLNKTNIGSHVDNTSKLFEFLNETRIVSGKNVSYFSSINQFKRLESTVLKLSKDMVK